MSKGGNWEREVCRILSQWWSGDPDCDDLFWRTAGSGARATVRGKKGKRTANHVGDICSTDPSSKPFIDFVTVEAKRGYSGCSGWDLLDKPDGAKEQRLEEWIRKAETCKENAKSYSWIIIHRRNRREPVVIFPESIIIGEDYPPIGSPLILLKVSVDHKLHRLMAVPLTNFLEWQKPERIKQFVEKWNRVTGKAS